MRKVSVVASLFGLGLCACLMLRYSTNLVALAPEAVSVCELKRNPAANNGKLVRVTAHFIRGFESSGMVDKSCADFPNPWVEYGGTRRTGTLYCCGVSTERFRPTTLTVEGIHIPLADDRAFALFDRELQRVPSGEVDATVIGRFFAGTLEEYPGGKSWGGYGHMGCCSLFVVQQVVSSTATRGAK